MMPVPCKKPSRHHLVSDNVPNWSNTQHNPTLISEVAAARRDLAHEGVAIGRVEFSPDNGEHTPMRPPAKSGGLIGVVRFVRPNVGQQFVYRSTWWILGCRRCRQWRPS